MQAGVRNAAALSARPHAAFWRFMSTVKTGGLEVDQGLFDLVDSTITPGTGVTGDQFFGKLNDILTDMVPKNKALLAERDVIQEKLNAYYKEKGANINMEEYKQFLLEIGYLVPEGGDFQVTTTNVDPEICELAGPQLVVPVDNARYCLNAANARWVSLLDALYGTDVIPESPGGEIGTSYNPQRGADVFAHCEGLLDEIFPLTSGSYSQVTEFGVDNGVLALTLEDGSTTGLANTGGFAGYQQESGSVSGVLFKSNGLHMEVKLNRDHPIGKSHRAGMYDVVMESAVSTIMDCEDSVAAVDAEDKTQVYSNWDGLMKGTLSTSFNKGDSVVKREMNPDKVYTSPSGETVTLRGRSTLLVRNVGIHMWTDAVTKDGEQVPEGILDAMVTSLSAVHSVNKTGKYTNTETGSVYIVKPKMHGPKEVAFTVELFGKVEEALGLPANTLKVGIMDEERRTTVNLKECIRQASERVVFINTGFLDRTGDEIHTSMDMGPILPKEECKKQPWIAAYEDWNVDCGLETGLNGKGQIGKGMWAAPDAMAAMIEQKIAHPMSGATTAWVPSPTGAALHALHYHRVSVKDRQAELATRVKASIDDILTVPLLDRTLTNDEIALEIDLNTQAILGYVSRWVNQGVGCSKVPDLNGVGLMEDRATLRIASQLLANWLHHDICSEDEVKAAMKRMAVIVDDQNSGDAAYVNMSDNLAKSVAYKAAEALIFRGVAEPNGYTEPSLTEFRRQVKNHGPFYE